MRGEGNTPLTSKRLLLQQLLQERRGGGRQVQGESRRFQCSHDTFMIPDFSEETIL